MFSTLNAFGLPDTSDAHEFVQEVYSRAPRKHKQKADASRKQTEKESKALRAQKYSFVLEDDASVSTDVAPVKKSKKRTEERTLRKREYDGKEWESDACVMSDWFGVYSIDHAINAGLDLEMPVSTPFWSNYI